MILIGKEAPNFQAPAVVDGKKITPSFSLTPFKNKKNILFFFYPKDFTFVCPTELFAFQERLAEFEKRNTVVIGCSTDTEETHLAWLNTPKSKGGIEGISYPLVADTAKTISMNYQVLGGNWGYDEHIDQAVFKGLPIAYRGTFFIDLSGIIRHISLNDLPLGRNIDELLRIIDMWHHVEAHGEVCPANWVKGQDAMSPTKEGVIAYLNT